VQALIFDGPWPVEVGSFGMQPSGAGCPDGSYKFDLARSTEVDPAQHPALSESVREYLTDAGYDVEGQELGSGEAESTDVIVRKQGGFLVADGDVHRERLRVGHGDDKVLAWRQVRTR
jgi:hypothetical protein